MREYKLFYNVDGERKEYPVTVSFKRDSDALISARNLAWSAFVERTGAKRSKETVSEFNKTVRYSFKCLEDETHETIKNCPCCGENVGFENGELKSENRQSNYDSDYGYSNEKIQFIGRYTESVKAVKCESCNYIMLFAD